MFKDEHSYPYANSITDSKILSWKLTKIYAMYEHYSLSREFLKIKENQDHHLNIKWKIYWFS